MSAYESRKEKKKGVERNLWMCWKKGREKRLLRDGKKSEWKGVRIEWWWGGYWRTHAWQDYVKERKCYLPNGGENWCWKIKLCWMLWTELAVAMWLYKRRCRETSGSDGDHGVVIKWWRRVISELDGWWWERLNDEMCRDVCLQYTWNVLMDERSYGLFNMCGHADLWCRLHRKNYTNIQA